MATNITAPRGPGRPGAMQTGLFFALLLSRTIGTYAADCTVKSGWLTCSGKVQNKSWDLEGRDITTLGPLSFADANVDAVQEIDLRDNPIVSIDPNTFNKFKALTQLRLSPGNLSCCDVGPFLSAPLSSAVKEDLQCMANGKCVPVPFGIPLPQFNGGCYHYYESSVSYSNALSNCEQEGGSLVSIHTSAENTFVLSTLQGKATPWIGLSYDGNDLSSATSAAEYEDLWSSNGKWSDGSSVDYLNLNTQAFGKRARRAKATQVAEAPAAMTSASGPTAAASTQAAGGSTEQRALVMDASGTWLAAPWSALHPYVCKKESKSAAGITAAAAPVVKATTQAANDVPATTNPIGPAITMETAPAIAATTIPSSPNTPTTAADTSSPATAAPTSAAPPATTSASPVTSSPSTSAAPPTTQIPSTAPITVTTSASTAPATPTTPPPTTASDSSTAATTPASPSSASTTVSPQTTVVPPVISTITTTVTPATTPAPPTTTTAPSTTVAPTTITSGSTAPATPTTTITTSSPQTSSTSNFTATSTTFSSTPSWTPTTLPASTTVIIADEYEFTVEGSVDDFDRSQFQIDLSDTLGVSVDEVKVIDYYAGSVIVRCALSKNAGDRLKKTSKKKLKDQCGIIEYRIIAVTTTVTQASTLTITSLVTPTQNTTTTTITTTRNSTSTSASAATDTMTTIIPGPCYPNPCANNATCSIGPTGRARCNCTVGFWGPTCSKACTTCVDGKYNAGGCDSTVDTICNDCTVCTSDQVVVTECNITADRVCQGKAYCGTANVTCGAHAQCVNTTAGHDCTCMQGYASYTPGVGCVDVNECDVGAGQCGDGGTCINTAGSFTCSCSSGYYNNANATCTVCTTCQTDQITTANCTATNNTVCVATCSSPVVVCPVNQTCVDTPNGYTCSCPPGYTGYECTDINECSSSVCPPNSTCTNYPGNYTCACNSGYYSVSPTNCTACTVCNKIQYMVTDCSSTANRVCAGCTQCSANQYLLSPCNSTATSVCLNCSTCTGDTIVSIPCNATADTVCRDKITCSSPGVDCGPEGLCRNTSTGYECACNSGYARNGTGNCTDINECLDPKACQSNSVCTNTVGSFECTCNKGFFLLNNSCARCSECNSTEYMYAACTPTSDTQCWACQMCGENEFEASACNATANRVCTACSTCPKGQYQVGACNATTDTHCKGCKKCAAGEQYETSPCTATTNRQCALCSQCVEGQYEKLQCSGTQDRVCNDCKQCGAGYFTAAQCTATNNTQCQTCTARPDCQLVVCTSESDSVCKANCNPNYYLGNNGTCLSCTTNTANCLNVTHCTFTSDTQCGACKPGYTDPARFCTKRCSAPANCQSSVAASCSTDGSNPSCPSGQCTGGYYNSGDSICQACSIVDPSTCQTPVACTSTTNAYCGQCRTGYALNGGMCTDINECTNNTHTCAPQATCTNVPGSFTCSCSGSFFGSGTTCTPCSATTNCASQLVQCTATSDYVCATCKAYYSGTKCAYVAVNLTISSDCATFSATNFTVDLATQLNVPLEDVKPISQKCGSVILTANMTTTAADALQAQRTGNSGGLESLGVQSVQVAGGPTTPVGGSSSAAPTTTDLPTSTSVESQTSSPTDNASGGGTGGLGTGAIVGIVLGVVAGLVAVAGAVLFARRRNNHNYEHEVEHGGSVTPPPPPAANNYENGLPPPPPSQPEPAPYRPDSESNGSAALSSRPLPDLPANIPANIYQDANSQPAMDLREEVRRRDGLIPRSTFTKLNKLGGGAFGFVYQGALSDNGRYSAVALKELRSNDPAEIVKFMEEATLMKQLKHVNVVSCLGVAEGEPLTIVLELMTLGDLLNYMFKRRGTNKIPLAERLWYALQIARGMQYLSANGIVHRDLAARNCMLSEPTAATYGYPVLKVSDFGLSRKYEENKTYYRMEGQGKVPIAWMAPETLQERKFSHASDVWSYGITLWEIATEGDHPYEGLNLFSLIPRLAEGYRLPKPADCPQDLYDVMLHTWQLSPDQRPTFYDLSSVVADMFVSKCPTALVKTELNGEIQVEGKVGSDGYVEMGLYAAASKEKGAASAEPVVAGYTDVSIGLGAQNISPSEVAAMQYGYDNKLLAGGVVKPPVAPGYYDDSLLQNSDPETNEPPPEDSHGGKGSTLGPLSPPDPSKPPPPRPPRTVGADGEPLYGELKVSEMARVDSAGYMHP